MARGGGARAARWPVLAVAARLIATAVCCSLNPQPIPPGASETTMDAGAGGGVRGDAAAEAPPNQADDAGTDPIDAGEDAGDAEVPADDAGDGGDANVDEADIDDDDD